MIFRDRISNALKILFGFEEIVETRDFFTENIPLQNMLPGFSQTYQYEVYMTEGFQRNPVVFGCMDQISKGCSSVVLELAYDGEVLPRKELPPHLQGLYDLLKRPNPNESQSEFLRGFGLHIMGGGISYVQKINIGTRQIAGSREALNSAELWLLRPDHVRIKYKDRLIEKYLVNPDTAQEKPLDPDECYYVRLPDGMTDHSGMPPMKAAAYAIDTNNKQLLANYHLMLNDGMISGIVFLKGLGNLTDAERSKQEKWWQRKFTGPRNSGKIAVVGASDADYKRIGTSPRELDWANGDISLMRKICMVFGVPSKLLDDPTSSTYNNVRDARKAFYENTILPIMKQKAEEMTGSVAVRYDDLASIVTSTKHISCLQEDKSEIYTRMNNAYYLTIGEKRVECGFEKYPQEKQEEIDEIYIPMGLQPLTGILEPPPAPVPDPVAPPPPPEEGKGIFYKPRKSRIGIIYHPNTMFRTREERESHAQSLESRKEPHRAEFRKQMHGYWDWQLAQILKRLDATAIKIKSLIPGDVTQIFRIPDVEIDALYKILRETNEAVIIDFGEYTLKDLLGKDIALDLSRPSIANFLAVDIAERSQIISVTTGSKIRDTLLPLMDKGEGITNMRDALRETFEEMDKYRAALIANTETTNSASKATLEGFLEGGIELKEWNSAYAGDMRDWHVAMDGEIVAVNDFFSNGGMMPGMSGDPGEDCNCQCFVTPIEPGAGKIYKINFSNSRRKVKST